MLWLNSIPDPLIVILGPTGVGKSDLAVETASILGAEIISADSRLFYKGMDIGTAKPERAQQEKVPHHLIDILEPNQTWSLVDFQTAVGKIIKDIYSRNRIPILVGGSGQYIRSILENWQAPQSQPCYKLRLILEQIGREVGATKLHVQLAHLDKDAASRIEPHNLRRTVRALEVILTSGRLFSEQTKKSSADFSLCLIGLRRTRSDLYARNDQRIDQMVKNGLLEETRGLLDNGVLADCPAMSAIGYREMVSVLNNEISMDEAVAKMKRTTRQFVRRQANWFKENDPQIHWFNAEALVVSDIIGLINQAGAWIKKPSGASAPDGEFN